MSSTDNKEVAAPDWVSEGQRLLRLKIASALSWEEFQVKEKCGVAGRHMALSSVIYNLLTDNGLPDVPTVRSHYRELWCINDDNAGDRKEEILIEAWKAVIARSNGVRPITPALIAEVAKDMVRHHKLAVRGGPRHQKPSSTIQNKSPKKSKQQTTESLSAPFIAEFRRMKNANIPDAQIHAAYTYAYKDLTLHSDHQ